MKQRYQVKVGNDAEIVYDTPFGKGKGFASTLLPNFTPTERVVYDGFSMMEARQTFAQQFHMMTGVPLTNQVPLAENHSTKFCDVTDPNAICHVEVLEQHKDRLIPIARTILMTDKENIDTPSRLHIQWNSMIDPSFFATKNG